MEDTKGMRQDCWFTLVVCFIQCFDTRGWVAGRTSGPQKTNTTNLQSFYSGTGGGRGSRGNQLTQIHLEERPRNGRDGSTTLSHC